MRRRLPGLAGIQPNYPKNLDFVRGHILSSVLSAGGCPRAPGGWASVASPLPALPDAAVVERKTVPDLLGCIGSNRQRFERELKRGRYVGRFMVIIEGTLADVIEKAQEMIHPASIIGTLAAWQRRYCPILFAGTPELAARVAESFLCSQIREVERQAKALAKLSA